jgi:4-amino-4-deoxy-L-arabinose transferase-like glycosyltransferase
MKQNAVPMEHTENRWQAGPLDLRLLSLLVGAKLLVHLLTSGRYGYFRDELYFLDCARHLDWGYVDHAPLVALYAKIALLLGGSLPALRLLPAVAGAALVALTMLIARDLGGGRFAQSLAGLCVFAAPVYLALDSLMTMNAFEPLFWMGCAYVLIRIVRTGNARLWVWFGVLAGLGLENKHSTLLFGFAVAVALLLSPQRRALLEPWLWVAGGIALLIFLPNVLWQVRHGFPTLDMLKNVSRTGKNVELGPLPFVGQQILTQLQH